MFEWKCLKMLTYAHRNRFVSTHRWRVKHFNADNAAGCAIRMNKNYNWDEKKSVGNMSWVYFVCATFFQPYDIIWCLAIGSTRLKILFQCFFPTWNPKCWVNNIFMIATVTIKMMLSKAKASSSLLYNGLLYNTALDIIFSFYKKWTACLELSFRLLDTEWMSGIKTSALMHRWKSNGFFLFDLTTFQRTHRT